MALNQGPGRNIDFCLITTGFNIDPNHGGEAAAFYDHLKRVITQKAEIHYEDPSILEVYNRDVNSFLQGYNNQPRAVYQALFGLVQHSNGWDETTLTRALDRAKFPGTLYPKDGQISIDWQKSREQGFKIFKTIKLSGVQVWEEIEQFYYNNREPKMGEGDPGDVHFIQKNGSYELWLKVGFNWQKLYDHLQKLNPPGTIFVQTADPGNAENRYWLDITGLQFKQYNASKRKWSGVLNFSIQPTAPTSPLDTDLWIKRLRGTWTVNQWDASISKWVPRTFSPYSALDPATNGVFDGKDGENNFVWTCDKDALQGGPLAGGGGNLEIRKDGVTVQTLVDCLNFKGPDLTVTSNADCVTVEHNEFTTLPTQSTDPANIADAGRIYTQTIGGRVELFYVDDNNNITQLTNNGSTAQNIFTGVLTTNAVNGQTSFSVPSNVKAIITMKINGLDTIYHTLTSGTVIYDPVAANYTIESGDKVTIIYYT